MASLSRGKRMLKASLVDRGDCKKNRLSPDAEAKLFCEAGLDKDGFEVKYISDYKGFGVLSKTNFAKGDFLLQYTGERLEKEEGEERLKKKDGENKIFFYTYQGKELCIDAEGVEGHVCQYVNDGCDDANSQMKLKVFNKKEYLCLYASKDIMIGEEILYDYGDDVKSLWWRSKKNADNPFDFVSDIDSDPFSVYTPGSGGESDSDQETLGSMLESCGPQHDMEINENSAVIVSLHSEEESMPESCGPQHDMEINENQAVITSLHSEGESMPESCGPQHDMEINENQAVITSLHSEEGSVAYARVETVDFVENSNLSTLSEEVPYQSFSFLSSCEEDHQSNTRLNTEEKDCNGETKQKSKQKKPNRFCTYCKTIITGGKLKRHILRKHRTETEVQSIISKPQHIQNNFFDKKRREGIYEYNVQLIGDGFDAEMRERKPVQQDQLRVCSDCKGFYSNKYFFKHKCSNNDSAPQALKPKLLAKTMDDKMDRDPGFVDILNRFRQGEIGDFCRTNKTIKLIGYKHFNLRRHEEGKQDEVRKIIMAEMRELSKLFFCFKNLSSEHCTVEDLFRREHLPDLIEALQQVTTDKQEKHGQKLFLDAVLLRSVKTLEGYFAQTMQDEKKKELKNFKSAYKSLSHELFPSARQKCIKNSLEKNRKPANLPNEQKVIQIKEYIAAEIPIILKDYTVKNFAWLRSLVVARLTLFNARRGEEASRLLISEWEEAEKGVWLPDEELEKITDPAEQYLLGQFKLAYLKGKGKKYVPILIPNDLLSAIQVIKRDRFLFGIREENPFLFATKIGLSHCSGWHAVAKVCAETGIHIITATKMRHRLSCIYASLDMSAENQKIFLQHMGHEERINKENYQCPLGVRTACVMGRMLRSVDEGSVSSLMEGACPKAVDEHEERVAISQGSVSSLVEGACLKAVGEHEEHDAISQDHPFETNDTDTTTCRKKKERSNSVKWSKEETKLIRDHFQGYIFTRSDKNTGNLPSKKEIEEFLETNCIKTLKDLDKKTQSFKMKTKIFNERKMTRERATRRLQDLKSRD